MMERKMSKIEVRREEMESVTPAMDAVGGALLVKGEALNWFTDMGVWFGWK